jgi:hypothetical protein
MRQRLGGAKALDSIGRSARFCPARKPIIVAVDLSGIDAVPCYDPVSHLVHASGGMP